MIRRQIDPYRSSAIILEAAGGFIGRCLAPGERTPQVLEFPDRDYPLLPAVYEDFLRAVGHVLDQGKAQAITIGELDRLVRVKLPIRTVAPSKVGGPLPPHGRWRGTAPRRLL